MGYIGILNLGCKNNIFLKTAKLALEFYKNKIKHLKAKPDRRFVYPAKLYFQ